MVKNTIQDLLDEGFTGRYAKYYLDALEYEKECSVYDPEYRDWAHSKGFLVEYASAYGLNEENYKEYLSDYDYYKICPLNSWARIWVNDKLTLKYMLHGTKYEKFMPAYYYYSMSDGLRVLVDNPYYSDADAHTLDAFVKTLVDIGEFACKPNNEAMSKGFFKLSFINGKFDINGKEATESDIKKFVVDHPNYVFQEYIRPTGVYSEIADTIHTIRLVVLNESGNNPKIKRGYIRFPSKWSGVANYVALDGKNPDIYTIYADFNVDTGEWGNAKLIFADHTVDARYHPENNIELSGKVDDYDKLKELILGMSSHFNTLEYIGFDIGITEKGFRLMEINTHPEIRGLQVFGSVNRDSELKDYYCRKVEKINSLTKIERQARNAIQR